MSQQPWIRKVELVVGALPDWQQPASMIGPAEPVALRITSNGATDSLRIRFRVVKHGSGYAQISTIDVYNLGPELRERVRVASAAVILSVGWDNVEMEELLIGSLQSAYSRREGADIVTTLVVLSQPSGIQTAYVGQAEGEVYIGPEEPLGGEGGALMFIASQFATPAIHIDPKNIRVPNRAIGARGYSYSGLVSKALDDLARAYGFTWAVIDGEFVATVDGLELLGQSTDISSENGFLIRVEPNLDSYFQHTLAGVTVVSLLNPQIKPCRAINVTSGVTPSLSGSYYVAELTHTGDTHGNQWETVTQTHLLNNSGVSGL